MIQKGKTGGDQFETSAVADQQMNWWVTEAKRAFQALMTMKKIDSAVIEAARRG